jgi:Zn ribbon nucleic-acid-binding protein
LGFHDLSAVVLTKDGQTLTTAVQRYEFASAAQESAAVRNIIVPLLSVVFVVIVVVIGIQVLTSRRRPKVNTPLGAARHYGINGGTICPKCHRPFALHWWALNAGITAKVDRCDYCGRYGFFKRYSREELAAAEAAEQQMAQPETPIQPASAEQKLKEMLDESRYTDKS